jgi:gas vesicle protein
MKKITLVLVVVGISLVLLSANPGDYTDVKNLFSKQATLMQNYINACANVKEAKDVVAIFDNLKEGFKELMPDIKALVDKYGDLEKLFEDETPEELKADLDKMKDLTQKMMTESMKLSQYAQDPDVVKSQQDLTRVMKEIDDMVKAKAKQQEEENSEEKTVEKKEE